VVIVVAVVATVAHGFHLDMLILLLLLSLVLCRGPRDRFGNRRSILAFVIALGLAAVVNSAAQIGTSAGPVHQLCDHDRSSNLLAVSLRAIRSARVDSSRR
ncbi:unnamed protein product, partial [Ectocarpus sp. 12 AP-2014]